MARPLCPARMIENFIRHTIGSEATSVPARFPRTSLRTHSRYLTTRTPPSAVSQGAVQSEKLHQHDTSLVRELRSSLLLESVQVAKQTRSVEQHADANSASSRNLDEELNYDTSHGTTLANDHNALSQAVSGKNISPKDETSLSNSGHSSTVDAISLPSLTTLHDRRKLGHLKAQQQDLTVDVPVRTKEERRNDRRLRKIQAKKEAREAKAARRKPALPGPKRFRKAKKNSEPEEDELTFRFGRTSNDVSETAAKREPERALKGKRPTDYEGEQVASMLEDVERTKAVRGLKSKQDPADTTRRRNEPANEALQKPIFRRPREEWQIQKAALKKKFSDQPWNPRKRISPDAIAGVKSLHESDPSMYSTERLSQYFQISPDAVRRILKSRWQPSEKEAVDRRDRWERRGERKWTELAAEGVKPPRKWRERGIGAEIADEQPSKTTWRKPELGQKGERWIEHRSPDDLFAMAAQTPPARSTRRAPAVRMSDRFL